MNAPTDLVTRAGETLTRYAWESLEASYRKAGLDPATHMTVVQGSHGSGGAAASGSTHDKGDTADLRTRTLPASAQANLCGALVTALRSYGWCAWYRDQAHGGMDPHIHAVYRWADPPLSSGAQSQVRDYDAGRNGLSSGGPDYHPRPPQSPYEPPAPPKPPAPLEDDAMLILVNATTEQAALLSGSLFTVLTDTRTATKLTDAGVRKVTIPSVDWNRLNAEGE